MNDVGYNKPNPAADDIETALNKEVDAVMSQAQIPYKGPESPYSKANDAEIVSRIDRACNEIKSVLSLVNKGAPILSVPPVPPSLDQSSILQQDVRVSTRTMDLLRAEADVLCDLVYELTGRQ